MAIHKRIRIASGFAVPAAGQASVTPGSEDKAEHFHQMTRRPRSRRQMVQTPPRRNWKKMLMMILILLVASYLIYMVLKGSKSSAPLSADIEKPSSKVFYF
jgi:hypothetical protein